MKTLNLILLFALLSAFAFTPGSKPEFSLYGTVTAVDGKDPVIGATVKLSGSNNDSHETKTDEKGSYYFGISLLKAETDYTVTVSAPGFKNATGKTSTKGLKESETLSLDFEMERE